MQDKPGKAKNGSPAKGALQRKSSRAELVWEGKYDDPGRRVAPCAWRAIPDRRDGQIRTVRLAKEGSLFCYPENIDREMRRVFSELANRNFLRDLDRTAFAHQAAHLLAEINAIHPFREGNGRAQNTFLKILAERAGHSLDFAQLDPSAMLAAMIASFAGDEQPLAALIRQLIRG